MKAAVAGVAFGCGNQAFTKPTNNVRIHDEGPTHGDGISYPLIKNCLHVRQLSHSTDENQGKGKNLPGLTAFLKIIRAGCVGADVTGPLPIKSLTDFYGVYSLRFQ